MKTRPRQITGSPQCPGNPADAFGGCRSQYPGGELRGSRQICRSEPADPDRLIIPAESTTIPRLPGCDQRTRGLELAAFLGLGIVAVWLVAGACRDSANFIRHQEEIAAALSSQWCLVAGNNSTNHMLTNLTAVPVSRQAGHFEPGRAKTRPS